MSAEHDRGAVDVRCNTLNANLEATSIAVSGTAFDYRGKANFGTSAARMNIRFKGSWQTASKVTGFTRIWDSNCDSGKVDWT